MPFTFERHPYGIDQYRDGRCRPKPQRSQIVLRNDRGSAHAIFRAETAFPPKAPFRSPREHKTERKRPFWAAPAIRRRFSGNSFAENLYNHLGATQKQGFCGEVLRIPPYVPRNVPLLGLRPAAQAPQPVSDHRRDRRPQRSLHPFDGRSSAKAFPCIGKVVPQEPDE